MALYAVPSEFARRLDAEFNKQLRIRWSQKRHAWQIEAKAGRAADLPVDSELADDQVRTRDGYRLVCEVRPGTRMPCPTCGLTLRVPELRFAEVACAHCMHKGRDGRTMAGYFPLSETLLDHLRLLDPKRDFRRQRVREMDLANERRQRLRELEVVNDIGAVSADLYNRLHEIPQFGYTRTDAWHGAPDSPGLR